MRSDVKAIGYYPEWLTAKREQSRIGLPIEKGIMRLLFRTGFFIFILTFAAPPSRAQDGRSLVRVHIPGFSPSSIPFQIAEEQGFYHQEGIDVRSLRMKTGSGVQAMLAGDIDVSQITGPTVLAAILQGAPLKVVMVFNDKPTYRLYVKKEIRSFADLKGAKIGSSTPGSTSDRLLKIVLEKNNIHWQKETLIVYIGTTEVVLKALKSGAIDAAVVTPPADFLAQEGGFHELATFENEVAGRIYDGKVSAFVSNGLISEDFQEKVLDFELKAIGTDKKIRRDEVFDFSVVKSLATN